MIYVTVSFCNGFSFRVLLFFFLTSGTCKIVLNSNHKEYSVKVKELELPNGMPLKEANLVVGKAILFFNSLTFRFIGTTSPTNIW